MSVINSMLRDLDRRQAPMPVKANVQPTLVQPKRIAPRSAIALCALIVLVILSWGHSSKETVKTTASMQIEDAKTETKFAQEKLPATEIHPAKSAQILEQENRRLTESFATIRHKPIPAPTALASLKGQARDSEAASMPPTVAANDSVNRLAPQSSASSKKNNIVNEKTEEIRELQKAAPIVKQERKTDDDINAERYQLARNALAQNQPQRAFDLLRDNQPSLANNTDYHAVLAAVEQQLGHFADASLRYQQLLTVDQNQASWWLGLALSIDQNRSLDGIHRNNEALAAYQRATQLNSLPEAARQYAAARIAALSHSAEQ